MRNILINRQVDTVLAVGILLVFVFTLYFFVHHVYIEELSSLSARVELLKKKNAKIQSILVNEKALKEKIRKQKLQLNRNKIFLASQDSTGAASELQNYLKKLITAQSRAKILTIKPYPVVQQDGYSEVSLEIRMKDMSHSELKKVLYMAENSFPVMMVSEIDIKRTQLRYKSVVKTNNQDKLQVILVVSGYFREHRG